MTTPVAVLAGAGLALAVVWLLDRPAFQRVLNEVYTRFDWYATTPTGERRPSNSKILSTIAFFAGLYLVWDFGHDLIEVARLAAVKGVATNPLDLAFYGFAGGVLALAFGLDGFKAWWKGRSPSSAAGRASGEWRPASDSGTGPRVPPGGPAA